MEKKQFLQMVGQKLADQVSEWKIAVSARTVMKNNGVCKEGLTVCIEDDAVNPTLYLEQEYDDFMSGTCSIEEIVEKSTYLFGAEPSGGKGFSPWRCWIMKMRKSKYATALYPAG